MLEDPAAAGGTSTLPNLAPQWRKELRGNSMTDAFLAGAPVAASNEVPELPEGATAVDALLAGRPVAQKIDVGAGDLARNIGAGAVEGVAALPKAATFDAPIALASAFDPLVKLATGASQSEIDAVRKDTLLARGRAAVETGLEALKSPKTPYSETLRTAHGVASFVAQIPSIAEIQAAGGIGALAAAFAGMGGSSAWREQEERGAPIWKRWAAALQAGGVDSATALAMGPILERATAGDAGSVVSRAFKEGGVLGGLGAAQTVSRNMGARALGDTDRQPMQGVGESALVGALGGALVGGGAQKLRNLALERNAAPEAAPSVPLTEETRTQGDAFVDPTTGQWRVQPHEPPPAETQIPASPEPQASAEPQRALRWVDAGKPLKLQGAFDASPEVLLAANETEGREVAQPDTPAHQFAEEFARIHGVRASLDVTADPVSVIYHEAIHALRRSNPEALAKLLEDIHASDPEGFQKHLDEYRTEFEQATGKPLSSSLATEEGVARMVERLSGYVTAAFTDRAHLEGLLQRDPSIVTRVIDWAVQLLQKMGVSRWKTSQQKALVSLRLFARSSTERGYKPNRAAELALKIRDAFRSIEGMPLGEPKEEVPAPGANDERAARALSQGQGPGGTGTSVPEQATQPIEQPSTPAPASEWDSSLPVEEQLKSQAAREHLQGLVSEMGHSERGGKLLMHETENRVIGRTKWVPRSSWWMSRPGKMTETEAKLLVKRATSEKPGKFTERQRQMLEFLLNQESDRERMSRGASSDWLTQQRQMESLRSDEALAERESEGGETSSEQPGDVPFSARSDSDKGRSNGPRFSVRTKQGELPWDEKTNRETEQEMKISRGDTSPLDDDRFGRLMRGEKMPLKVGDSIYSLLKGYAHDLVPNFDLKGAKVRSNRDIATLFSALRSPYVERLAWMVIDSDGVVHDSGIYSVGTINSGLVPVQPEEFALSMGRALGSGRTLLVSHNHPSGNEQPSQADLHAYQQLHDLAEKAGSKFAGLVIDHTKFSWMRNQGYGMEVDFHPYDPKVRYEATKEPRPALTSPRAVAEVFARLHTDPGSAVLMSLDGSRTLRAVRALDVSRSLPPVSEIEEFVRSTGGYEAIIAHDQPSAAKPLFEHYLEDRTSGLVLDVLGVDHLGGVHSARSMSVLPETVRTRMQAHMTHPMVVDEKIDRSRFSVRSKEDIDPLGFYSPLRRALDSDRLPAKAPGSDWLNIIRKAPGAKRDEIEWSGVEQFLEGKKSVTRQELQNYLRENEVKVEEVQRGGSLDAIAEGAVKEPVYPGSSYRLPGGKNYRELLLTLPAKPGSHTEALARIENSLLDVEREYHEATARVNGIAWEFRSKASAEGLPGSHMMRAITGAPHESVSSGASRAALELASGRERVSDELVSVARDYADAKATQEAAWERLQSLRRERARIEGEARDQQFTDSHWTEPNVLAHMRTTDRTDSNGRGMLFLEEMQSDWHQKGRDRGYRGSEEEISRARHAMWQTEEEARSAMSRLGFLGFDNARQAMHAVVNARGDWKQDFDARSEEFPEETRAIDSYIAAVKHFERIKDGVLKAPFAETWHELAMRRAIRYAAENGYQSIGWTRGIDQVERYSSEMRAAVDEISTRPASEFGGHPDQVMVTAKKDGRTVWERDVWVNDLTRINNSDHTLEDIVGSQVAAKIRADPSKPQRFTGEDLAIGGKGMQTFYDEILPRAAAKIAKPWMVKPGEARLTVEGAHEYRVDYYDAMHDGGAHGDKAWGIFDETAQDFTKTGYATREQAEEALREFNPASNGPRIHSLEITPEMRASVLAEGLPRFAVASGPQGPSFDAPDETLSARFRRAFVNDLDRIEVLEKSAPEKLRGETLEMLGRLFPGRTFGEVEKLRTQVWKPMKETMRRARIQPFLSKEGEPSASDFLYALAALKANETLANEHPNKYGTMLNPGSGMSSVEADAIVTAALRGSKAGAYREIQRLNRQLNARRLDAWVSGQLITPKQRAELVRRWGLDYVPFRTSEDPAVKLGDIPPASKGFSVRGKEYRARMGRSSKADSPLAFAFDTAEQALERKERNRMGLALESWSEANHFPDFLRVEQDANKIKDGEFRLSFKRNGQQRWLVTKDKALYSAFKRLAPEPGVIRVFDKALQFLHSTIVRWNPAFPFYNMPKDLGTAAFKVGVEHGVDWSASVVKNAPAAARGSWRVLRNENASGKWEDIYKRARDAGALVGWNQQFDPTARLKDFEQAVNRKGMREAASKLFDFVDDANRAVELGTRMATFAKALEAGKTDGEAAVIARKVTADFAQRGTLTPVFRRLFLFFGAGVQGTREASMAIAKHPVRGAAAFGVAMASGYLFASLSRIFGDEDENGGSAYDRLSQYQLSHKAGVMVGKRLYGIPLPWFWNVPYYLGVQAEQMQNGERTAREAVPDVLTSALEAMSPISGSSPLQALTPTLMRPLEELATNQDYAGNPIRPEVDPHDRTPPPMSERAFRNINPALQEAARALNRWTGGNSVRPGMVSISPADMEHVIKFLAGGLGTNSWRALEVGRKALAGEYRDEDPLSGMLTAASEGPISRAYVAQPGRGATAELYYKNLARVQLSAKEGKVGEVPLEPWATELRPLANKVDETLQKLREARNQARDAGQDTKDLEDAMRSLMSSFNREVLRSRSASATHTPVEGATR